MEPCTLYKIIYILHVLCDTSSNCCSRCQFEIRLRRHDPGNNEFCREWSSVMSPSGQCWWKINIYTCDKKFFGGQVSHDVPRDRLTVKNEIKRDANDDIATCEIKCVWIKRSRIAFCGPAFYLYQNTMLVRSTKSTILHYL